MEGLGTQGRLCLEGLLLFISQLHSLVDYLPLGGRRRCFTSRASVSSLITHRCVVLVFASLFLNLYYLISAVDVILFGLDYVTNSVLAYLHFPHVHNLLISLNW